MREIPPEIRSQLPRTEIRSVQVDGDDATARLRLISRYAFEPDTDEVRLVREPAGWRVRDTPGDERPDTMTTCVIGGIQAFAAGDADPFWKQEGRADYVAFLRETCRRAVQQGVFKAHQGALTGAQRKDLQDIYAQVLEEMIRSGRVERPSTGR